MNYDECTELSSKLSDIAWNNYYKIETLKGYCENVMPDPLPSVMLFSLLDEICINSKQIIKLADNYSTLVGNQLLQN